MASETQKKSTPTPSRRNRRRPADATAPVAPARGGRLRLGRGAQVEADETEIVAGKGRATPGRRSIEEEEEKARGGNAISRFFYGLREYFEGVGSEIRKVSWPTPEDTRRLSIIVLITLIVMSIALGLVAFVFTEMFRLGLDSPIILIAFMVIAVGGGVFVARLNARRAGL
jgi:preprotein translocase subunit SecE